jgi:hypothetical protein
MQNTGKGFDCSGSDKKKKDYIYILSQTVKPCSATFFSVSEVDISF